MKVCIIGGTGYVGLVTGIGLAAKGNDVICADIDTRKIDLLNSGVLPIYEEKLQGLIEAARKQNCIRFTSCLKTAVTQSDIIMVAVGTPEGRNGETDISQLFKALKTIANYLDAYKLIVIKSTVPVGTCELAYSFISNNLRNSGAKFDIVSNPEFLREGSAVNDFLHPERIIVGVDTEKARLLMEQLYKPFQAPMIVTDIKSSEMIKYACNTYLATRISFINEMAEICEKVGADINSVIKGMKLDKRIGPHYLNPGPGFGGPCLSKDLKSLISFGSRANANVSFMKAVLGRNEVQVQNIVTDIVNELRDMGGRKIAVLGLSFKAGTNDIRNSPSIYLLEKLTDTRAEIAVYDPVVKQVEEPLNSRIAFRSTINEAVIGADCAVIMTEWDEFKAIDLKHMYGLMSTPFLYDARNAVSEKKARCIGFKYKGIGTTIHSKDPIEALQKII